MKDSGAIIPPRRRYSTSLFEIKSQRLSLDDFRANQQHLETRISPILRKSDNILNENDQDVFNFFDDTPDMDFLKDFKLDECCQVCGGSKLKGKSDFYSEDISSLINDNSNLMLDPVATTSSSDSNNGPNNDDNISKLTVTDSFQFDSNNNSKNKNRSTDSNSSIQFYKNDKNNENINTTNNNNINSSQPVDWAKEYFEIKFKYLELLSSIQDLKSNSKPSPATATTTTDDAEVIKSPTSTGTPIIMPPLWPSASHTSKYSNNNTANTATSSQTYQNKDNNIGNMSLRSTHHAATSSSDSERWSSSATSHWSLNKLQQQLLVAEQDRDLALRLLIRVIGKDEMKIYLRDNQTYSELLKALSESFDSAAASTKSSSRSHRKSVINSSRRVSACSITGRNGGGGKASSSSDNVNDNDKSNSNINYEQDRRRRYPASSTIIADDTEHAPSYVPSGRSNNTRASRDLHQSDIRNNTANRSRSKERIRIEEYYSYLRNNS